MIDNPRVAAEVLRHCAGEGVREYCIAAGARNAPLALAILDGAGREDQIYNFFDERAAAFFALGRCLATRRPVAVVTTSGTAVAELLPAIVEAYYQAAPLLAITADRPVDFRGTGAPQAIEQVGIFGTYAETVDYVEGGTLPELGSGPVHLNVPFDEPKAEAVKPERLESTVKVRTPNPIEAAGISVVEDFVAEGSAAAVVVGSLHPDERESVSRFLERLGNPVRVESSSNLRGHPALRGIECGDGSGRWDEVLGQVSRIMRIGGVPVGRWWRDLENTDHEILNLCPSGHPGISRSCLNVRVGDFSALDEVTCPKPLSGVQSDSDGDEDCTDDFPNSEPALIRAVSEIVPDGDAVFLGNSLPVRVWDFAAVEPMKETAFFANRGANGIDGALSTALGIGADYPGIWAVVGDLTALYDLSAPWVLPQMNEEVKVRIVVVNNGGGRIFSRLPALAGLGEERDGVIQNRHGLGFGHWAEMWGLEYMRVDCGEWLRKKAEGGLPDKVVIELVPDEAQTESFGSEGAGGRFTLDMPSGWMLGSGLRAMKSGILIAKRALLILCASVALLGIGVGQAHSQDDPPAPPVSEESVPTIPEAESAGEKPKEPSVDELINEKVKPIKDVAETIVFWKLPVAGGVPLVLILLAATAVILTILFKFVNLRHIGTALRTVRGKYTDPDAPGQITHFQALSAALSATVGLGNIAGVAIAIGIGGPGATLWMIVLGFLGMTTKFCECTLGVKYREIDEEGKVHGGAMYYLSKGLKERGLGSIGAVLAVLFAIFCIGGAFGAGNMFQVSQARDQVQNTFPELIGEGQGWIFGVVIALIVGAVIIGGIKSIGRVASVIVPFMCVIYIIAAFVVVIYNIDKVGDAFVVIVTYAFSPLAVAGGVIGALIQGVKRAAFSNEAGLGSAPIAHSAVKTNRPASEGMVALLEPLVDTVVVCTMTALVIVTTGMWKVHATVKEGAPAVMLADHSAGAAKKGEIPAEAYVRTVGDPFKETIDGEEKTTFYRVFQVDTSDVTLAEGYEERAGWVAADSLEVRSGNAGGVWLTSKSFESVIGWFPFILTIAVVLFCFSTMISWSYYGEQAVIYLFGHNTAVKLIYNTIFCLLVVVGAAASLGNILGLSDALIFAMVFPNLIGMYFLLPVVRREMKSYMEHVKKVDKGGKG